MFNPFRPDPGRKEKIYTHFYFQSSSEGSSKGFSKGFIKTLKAFLKPF